MATASVSKVFFIAAFILAVCSAALAVADDFAPAPAPAREAGSGFSLPVSGAVVGSALMLSLMHLLRH